MERAGVSGGDLTSAPARPGLYSARGVCHFSPVRFLLPLSLLLALLGAGCSTPMERFNKKLAKQESGERVESSRKLEQTRMLKVESGEAGSARGAEIMAADKYKVFDPSRSAVGGRTYDAGKAQTKDFYHGKTAAAGSYRTRDFSAEKTAWAGDLKFGTKQAPTKDYATKEAPTKTAATEEASDAGKTAASRGLPDGKREYLGPESKKLRTPVDPATMGDWRNTRETVSDSGGSIEKYSTMKTLTIDDIRELLNKNK